MKLQCTWLVRGLLVCSLPLAGMLITGCSMFSSNPEFSDTNPPPGALMDVAHFHVGDTVTVALTDTMEPQPMHEEAIKEDGTITLDIIGKVHAAGKTAGELQNEIHDLYVPKYYTHATVTVGTGERVYYVSGEVGNRGSQLYRSEITVSRAITAAGGFGEFANHKNVTLIRATGQRIKVNVDKVLAGKADDPPVYPGDQIVVARKLW